MGIYRAFRKITFKVRVVKGADWNHLFYASIKFRLRDFVSPLISKDIILTNNEKSKFYFITNINFIKFRDFQTLFR